MNGVIAEALMWPLVVVVLDELADAPCEGGGDDGLGVRVPGLRRCRWHRAAAAGRFQPPVDGCLDLR